ncbi:Na(+)-translocating NADH-quinone reductase subunit C [Dokdonia pacifica]|uniref:Na(+)-translocating NADH-quinone reductase subunit C n=1 Tax=Dokdonia pacifica TaxID=1627892 RepID=A0A239A512_9FLAO|nr:Na(+)-translocating NADH-quinone reductase subunit C [Dokdonia pacifica]GGG35010.1 Na(+)-translocating NADH-quinone reductase subunit C [Dokdonia pacifica]SNR90650.1 Na+-transporting NADH:ubiquinone oxidoreductase subunit C [Dokdonia pacifica]
MAKTDGNAYTVIFATVMVIVVGGILAGLAQGLKPAIKENERFEKQQNILYAMGVHENGDDTGAVNFIPTDKVEEAYTSFIKESFVFQNGKALDGEDAFKVDMKKQSKLSKSERKLPLFVGERDGKKFYVIPMYGKGLWDAIWGYVALDENLIVQGAFFDHKGETPGLGANIKERYFMDDFIGEQIMNGNKYAGITVAKGNNDPINNTKDDNEVDALAGATITGDGVSAMIKSTLKSYIPHIQKMK